MSNRLSNRKRKKKKFKRFQRVGHGLFRMRSNGIIYAVFKSAGKTRWKNLGTDNVNHARELLAEEIKRDVKINWKRSRTVSLLELIEHYETNPMNLASSRSNQVAHLGQIINVTGDRAAWLALDG